MKLFSGLLLLSLSLSLQLVTFPALGQSIKPGVWKGKATFTLNGIPLPTKEDEDCILPHEAKDPKSSIAKNIKKHGCSFTKWTVKGQKLDAALVCKGQDLDATGTMTGPFSETSYKLEGEAKGTYKEMLPATALITIQGDYLKPCAK